MIINRINRFRPVAVILIFFYLDLIVVPLIPNNTLLAQDVNKKIEDKSFSNSFCFLLAAQDTTKQKIIFKPKEQSDQFKIELLSSSQFKHFGETNFIGEKGINLKKSMGNNFESISMVDKAYRKKGLGKSLIIAGGVVALVGLVLPSTWVNVHEEESESYIKTWYWLPGFSIGAIIAGIGFNAHGSLTKDLKKAINVYNESLIEEKSNNKNED
jgi:hypothetical protein